MTGKDLIALGYSSAPWFKVAIQYFQDNPNIWECSEDRDSFIKSIIPKQVNHVLHEDPIPYSKFIDTESEEEIMNLMAVEDSMAVVMRTPTVVEGAIMPDACPAGPIGHIPVGGVVVAKNAIHPSMHSADICCSVMVTGFGNNDPKRVLDLIHNATDFGSGPRRKPGKFPLPKSLDNRIKDNPFFTHKAKAMAKSHLGTQGDGNHFSFVGVSKKTGETCLVTHHGSRGFGAQLYKAGMACAEKWRLKIAPSIPKTSAWIPFDSEDGIAYWDALQIVRDWTRLNHEVLHSAVKKKIPYSSKIHFWNEHNFVFKRDDLFYHAKGSTPMMDMIPDNKTGLRLIPLNMSEPVLIVSAHPENTFGFAPHGAGRNLSRTAFLKKDISIEKETQGLDVRFFFNNPDLSELPSAYKNAQQVKEQILKYNLANIEDEIIPYGCIMAGNNHSYL